MGIPTRKRHQNDNKGRAGAGGRGTRRSLIAVGVATVTLGAMAILPAATSGAIPFSHHDNEFHQTNLVSDLPKVALIQDTSLVNPWGLAAGPATPLWVADNGKDVATLYQGDVPGSPPPIMKVPLTVAIPNGTAHRAGLQPHQRLLGGHGDPQNQGPLHLLVGER